MVTAGQTRKSGGRIRRIQSTKTLKKSDVRAIVAQCPSVPKAAGSIRRSIILRYKENMVKTTLVGTEPDGFSLCNQLDFIRLQKETARSLTLLIGTVAALSWMVGGMVILAVILMAIRERRSEIGLRRALCARAGDVLWQFVFEAVILALAGTMTGLMMGLLGIWITHATGWGSIMITWSAAFLTVGISIFLGFACGVYPAIKASRLSPVVALKL